MRYLAIALLAAALCSVHVIEAHEKRVVTQRDSIEMVTLADPLFLNAGIVEPERVATFSPSGAQFVVVLRRGDVEANTNVYSMLLWRVSDALQGRPPQRLLEMPSTSNRGNINDVEWRDENTVTFLGAYADKPHQLYKLDIRSNALQQLTQHPTDVLSYSIDVSGSKIAYLATKSAGSIWNEHTLHSGVVVSTQYVEDLITGQAGNAFRGRGSETDAFVVVDGDTRAVNFRRDLPEILSSGSRGAISISPDGRYVVAATVVPMVEVPQAWRAYTNMRVRQDIQISIDKNKLAGMGQPAAGWSNLRSYELLDISTGTSRLAINTPIDLSALRPPFWSSDGARVFLSGVLRPVGDGVPAAQSAALADPMVVEVIPETLRYSALDAQCAQVVSWNASRSEATCTAEMRILRSMEQKIAAVASDSSLDPMTDDGSLKMQQKADRHFRIRKEGSVWRAIGTSRPHAAACEVALKQDMNVPPTLHFSCNGHKKRQILDLNPRFAELTFAQVRELQWEWASGKSVRGGLYLPVGYSARMRYPLIIQTHGWDPHAFWIDGFSTTGYAAQALAAKGFAVLQLMETFIPPQYGTDGQRKEVERAMAIYRSAIDTLDAQGVIDRSRVGIVGFSHTNFYVQYALAHHPELFAAAALGEGEGGGYLEFITRRNAYVDASSIYDGPPFGAYLRNWLALAPTFSTDRVIAPVRIVANNPRLLLVNWEWFESLTLQDKPVELTLLSDGEHVLMRPAERLVSQQGNVDWFDFWLNGRKDPQPDKVDQYARWERLCIEQIKRHPETDPACGSHTR